MFVEPSDLCLQLHQPYGHSPSSTVQPSPPLTSSGLKSPPDWIFNRSNIYLYLTSIWSQLKRIDWASRQQTSRFKSILCCCYFYTFLLSNYLGEGFVTAMIKKWYLWGKCFCINVLQKSKCGWYHKEIVMLGLWSLLGIIQKTNTHKHAFQY